MSDSKKNERRRLKGVMFGFLTRAKVDSLETAEQSLLRVYGEKINPLAAKFFAEEWWAKREAKQKASGKKTVRRRASQAKRGRGRPRKMGVRTLEKTPRVKRAKSSRGVLTIEDVARAKRLLRLLRENAGLSSILEGFKLIESLGIETATRLLNELR